jgi:hypothetical protein
MFFWNKDKEEICTALQSLQTEVDLLRNRTSWQADTLEDLTARLDRYEQILLQLGKSGFKKDGSPKAKPGRKAGT